MLRLGSAAREWAGIQSLIMVAGIAGLLGGRISGKLFDKYHNYQMAFYTAAVLAAVALIAEFLAKRPKHA